MKSSHTDAIFGRRHHAVFYGILDSAEFFEHTAVGTIHCRLVFLPEVVGKYFRKLRRQMVILHAVPSELAKHQDLVQIFQKHWNHWVSPGEALYAHRGPGVDLIEQCTRSQQIPKNRVREKHVFLNRDSPA